MSYESTKNSILVLEDFDTVSIEQMLGMIVHVVEDTYKNSSVKDISEMKLGNPEETIIRAYSISAMLLKAVDKNWEMIEECDMELWKECEKIVPKLETVNKQLEDKRRQVLKLREQKKMLKGEVQKLQKEEQNFKEIERECRELQCQLKQWNNSGLKEMVLERDKLRRVFQEKMAVTIEIEKEIAQNNERILLEKAVLQKKEKEKMESELSLEIIKNKKKELDKTILELKDKKVEYECLVTEFSKMNPDMQKHAEEYEVLFRELYTAVNSIMNDKFLMANLYQVPGADKDLTPDNYPDLAIARTKIHSMKELQLWLEGIQKRIKGLLGVYQAELRKLLECSEKLTRSI